jgi:hypothetical protein
VIEGRNGKEKWIQLDERRNNSELNGKSRIATFESNSRLAQIESEGFSNSSLESMLIPRNIDILVSKCFYEYKSLSSITFE